MNGPNGDAASGGAAGEEHERRFTHEGTEWTVREVPGDRVPAARGPGCLVFESAAAVRRVWNYPGRWRALSAAELVDLSWHR